MSILEQYNTTAKFFVWSILLSILSTLLTCCSPFRNVQRPNLDKLSSANYKELDGYYCFKYMDSTRKPVSAYDLQKLNELETRCVQLHFLTSKKVDYRFYFKDSLVSQKIIKGKFRGNYFRAKPSFFLIPFFPVFFYYDNHFMRIGKSGDSIFIDESNHTAAVIVIGSESGSKTFTRYLKKY